MKNISSMAALAALLLVSCGQDTDVKFAGDEGAKVTFSASINEQNSQDVSRVTGVTWDDGDEVSISCGPTQKNVFYRYNAADNSFTAINPFDEIWLLGNEEYDVTAYYPHVGEEGTVPPVQIVEITSENQDTPEERAAFDFLYASTKATKAEPNVHLNFNHAMSRVNLKFVPGTDPEGNPVTLTDIDCNNALQYINSYREQVSSPSSSSCWFLPSMTEFDEVAKGLTIINRKIVAVKGLELISGEVGTDGAHKSVNAYWTSNEHATNKELVDKHNITTESAIYGRRNEGSKAGRFRMMLAF